MRKKYFSMELQYVEYMKLPATYDMQFLKK